jgi:hypothetical protein
MPPVSVTWQALKAALGASVATGAAGASVAAGAAGASVGAGVGTQAVMSMEMTAMIEIRLNSSLLFMVSFLLRKFVERYYWCGIL